MFVQMGMTDWMQLALAQAEMAASCDEVPVGAVLVDNQTDRCIGKAYNQVMRQSDPTAHAEILALREAGLTRNNYRLVNTTLYVTLEPCPMCAMALVHARVSCVIYAASDPRIGACGSIFSLHTDTHLNHHFTVMPGCYADEAAALLKNFFLSRR